MSSTVSCHTPLRPRRASLVSLLVQTLAVKRQRRELLEMSDHQLADLGLSRTQAEAEGRRSLWDAPQHWMR